MIDDRFINLEYDEKVWARQLLAATRNKRRGGTLIEREKRVKSSAVAISGFETCFSRVSLDRAFFSSPVRKTEMPTANSDGKKNLEDRRPTRFTPLIPRLLVNTTFY